MAQQERRLVYRVRKPDVPERLVLSYGKPGQPHGCDTYRLEISEAAWVEIHEEREARPKQEAGGWRVAGE